MQKLTTEEKEFLVRLGHKIRQTRKARGMIQLEVAALTNAEKANISRIESGKTNTTIMTIKKFADAMSVQLSDLITTEL